MIGSRRPSGESPGIRKSLPRRSGQRSLLHARSASAFQRWIGSTKPVGLSRPRSNTRAKRARSSGIVELGVGGIDIDRQVALLHAANSSRPRRPAGRSRGPSAERSAISTAKPSAFGVGRRGPRRLVAISDGSVQIGSPSLRQNSEKAQRGRLSPGYHLPWPKCRKPPGAKRSRRRRIRSSAQRLLGRADRGGVPLRRVEIVDGDEGRLAAHGQAHVLRDEIAVDRFAERVEIAPRTRR